MSPYIFLVVNIFINLITMALVVMYWRLVKKNKALENKMEDLIDQIAVMTDTPEFRAKVL